MHRQDDPNKCTAAKLLKFKMANEVNKIPFNYLILDPFSKIILTQKTNKTCMEYVLLIVHGNWQPIQSKHQKVQCQQ